MERRSIPVCLTAEQHAAVELYARRRGMLDAGQALEQLLKRD